MPPATNNRPARADDRKSQLSSIKIKVNGSDLPATVMSQVADVTVEQDLVLPDAFSIRIRESADQARMQEHVYSDIIDGTQFSIGAEVEILMGYEGNPVSVLKGDITSLEMDARPTEPPVVTVRGYDKAYKLHREVKTATFLNKSDSDIISTIARAHGLTPQVETTTGVHTHVFQDNQTDWEFVRARANRIGYEAFVRNQKLVFRKPDAGGTAPEVTLGETLYRVRLRMATSPQVSQVMVKGWDPRAKQAIVGTAPAGGGAGPHFVEGKSGKQAATPLGTGKVLVSDPQVATQADANKLANSIYEEIEGDFIQLEGTCIGMPNLTPGGPLQLKKVGSRFSGKYYLTAVTHRTTPTEGYLTHFTVSGRRPATLAALLDGRANGQRAALPGANGAGPGRYYGVVTALVTNNKADPSSIEHPLHGQVKVKFPWLSNDQESAWARLAFPMAGAGRGFYFLPEVNDEVLVAFEGGDINRPYVIGSVWNGRDAPPKTANEVVGPDGKVKQRVLKTTSGHTITIDDSQDQPGISIIDKTGKNLIKLESSTNKLTINVDGDMVLEAQQAVTIKGRQVTVQSTGGPVDVQAQQALNLKGGTTANLEASTALTAKGGSNATLQANANVEVKGALATVQASGITEVKGSLVKIN